GVLTARILPLANRSACQHATQGGGTSVATTTWRNRASVSGRQHLTASEAEVFAVVGRHSNLLDPAPPTVVPQPPPLPAEDRVRLVHRIRTPPALPGSDDRVGRVSLPVGNAILRPGQADLGAVPISEPDVKHDVPIPLPHDLAGRHSIFFPIGLRVGSEDRIPLVLRPFPSIRARGVADGVRLVLLTARVPHSVLLAVGIVHDMRAHDGHLLPRILGGQDWLVARPLPGLAIRARRVPNRGLALGLAGVPQVVP